ncbi:MAG: Tyrosine recombinase XerD [Verrucomicrobia subdivision 3 bacterium]|nr:Tyrosine recombinase XerD [Limisphaerales bacterium]MCS1412942.1 Tyrosine recombinase XerD [Limisphaerales bacterium]
MTDNSFSTEDYQQEYLIAAISESTRLAYDKAWRDFVDYCNRHNVEPLLAPPDIVANCLIEKATKPSLETGKPLSVGTVSVICCAINRRYKDHEKASPTDHPKVKMILNGLRRKLGRPPRRVKALRERQIREMIKACGTTTIGLRDAAVLALGFSAALRRSEICALKVDDIEFLPKEDGGGLIVNICKSKTDQEAKGQQVAIPKGKYIQPAKHLRRWMKKAGIKNGYLFRTLRRNGALRGDKLHHDDVARTVKKYAEMIGLNPKEYAAHSLRAGFVTSAAVHNARLDKIMEVTRHTNTATVMKYIRDQNRFKDHAGQNFL